MPVTKRIEAGDNIRSVECKPSGDDTSDSDIAPIYRPVRRDLAAFRGCPLRCPRKIFAAKRVAIAAYVTSVQREN